MAGRWSHGTIGGRWYLSTILWCLTCSHVSGTAFESTAGDDRVSSASYLPTPSGSLTYQSLLPSEDASGTSSGSPYILVPPATHVRTRAGQTATLTCVVRSLGDKQVSWIRGGDLHVLSSGHVLFSSDSRVSVDNVGDAWKLTVRYTQPRDSGSYACQVNAQPKMVTWFNLTVVEARATILGKETMYVQSGSNVILECVVLEELLVPGLVLWYQDDHLVERRSSRLTITTSTDKETRSRLTITSADPRDSGNYSCWPSAGKPDSVVVHVIQGDPPAAMQHGNAASSFSTTRIFQSAIITFLLLLS